MFSTLGGITYPVAKDSLSGDNGVISMLDKVERFRTYEAIVEQIKKLVDAGKLSPGEKLPPERDLAVMLGTSRATVREACRVLEHMGLIESRIGSGRFVSETRLPASPSSVASAQTIEEDKIKDFVELRRILEIPMVEMAARNATPGDIGRMRLALDLGPNGETEPLVADMSFHSAIADASGNRLLRDFLNSELFLMYRLFSLTTSLPGRSDEVFDEHKRICEAVATHDPVTAAQLMRQHLSRAEKALSEVLQHRAIAPQTAASVPKERSGSPFRLP